MIRTRDITVEEVRALREETGKGMMECKKILQREILRDAIKSSYDIGDLQDVLLYILDNKGLV